MNPQSTIDPSAPENPNPPPEFSTAQFTKSGGKVKKILISLLVILLIAGGIYGGYAYGKGQNKDSAKSSIQPATTPPASQSSSAVHFVLSEGYPYDLGAKKIFTTKLGIPAELQAVRSDSDSIYRQYFTDKSNDEIGRWIIGNPKNTSENAGGDSNIYVLAISKSWLAANLSSDLARDSETATGYKLANNADKQKFLQSIKTNSDNCVKDVKKGFSTADGSFNICYTLDFGREGYSPMISLSGFGEKDNVPMYLTGLINIYDNTPMANRDAELKAIDNAKNGKYTANFSASLNSLLAALKQTTLTTADNPNKTN
jgi:hypothetical protein